MQVLLKSVKILAPGSDWHKQVTNILINDGHISAIGQEAPVSDTTLIIEEEGLHVSPGWLDMHAWVGDPGGEQKEDLNTAAQAAAKGGFTAVACLPNVEPIQQTKNAVGYIQNRSQALPVSFYALGAVTANLQGKDLTEMIDLHEAGVAAFTDGWLPIQQADVVVKALQYVQFFDGLIIQKPENTALTQHGLMHEGVVSTQLGLKGMPALAEEILLARDLKLLQYTGGKLHFTLVSTAEAVALIRSAKQEGLKVTCDMAAFQTAFTDEEILPFDTNYKVNPPFRSLRDKAALLEGLADGTIDALVSGHRPQDPESKNLEFDLAEFGITGLETAFAVANTYLAPEVSLENIITKLAIAPRQILNIPPLELREGAEANLTLFQPDKTWVPEINNTASKSKNNPFYGKTLRGQVYGIVHKNQLILNPEYTLRAV